MKAVSKPKTNSNNLAKSSSTSQTTPGTATNNRTGMGAMPHEAGVAFRVWVPHAEQVFVTGDFNEWSEDAQPLESEDAGYWYVDVPTAKVGHEYRYLIHNGERKISRIDPYAREVTNSVGNGIVHDPKFSWEGDDFTAPTLNELVIYELHVGSFHAEHLEGPGGFYSVMQKFGHLKSLGINCIQIMPAAEFAGDYSWGYNPAHMFAIESAYGGPKAFKEFVKRAHQQGFAVLLDVVYNHFGPSDLDLWQFDGWSENGKGGIYFYNDWRAETPWGETRPDYGRGEVRQFIRDNAMMWLEDYHVDGLRYDMTLYMRSVRGDGDPGADLPEGWSLTQWVNAEIRQRFPRAITVAEDLQNNAWLTKEPGAGGAGFHTQWDARFVHPIRSTVIMPDDQDRSMHIVRDAILANYNGDAFQRVVYSESHDEVANGKARVPSEVSPSDPQNIYAQRRSALATALVLTSPGVPMLFQGQEFLQGEWFRDDVPLEWDLAEEFHGMVRLYRDLIRLRLNRQGVSRGLCGQFTNVFHMNDPYNVIAFQRWDQHGPGDDVVVVVNLADQCLNEYKIGLPNLGLWKNRFNSDAQVYSDDFSNYPGINLEAIEAPQDGLPCSATLSIGPYSVLVYSQDKPVA